MSAAGWWRPVEPWAGLIAAVAGGLLAHQFGAEGAFDNCLAVDPVPLLAVAALCILCIAIAAWRSSLVLRSESEGTPRKLIAVVSVGFSALAIFATLLPMIAALVLPPCFQ
jgi:hypothetical protein